jgi:phospho-N-acetylmuramoyl-pentapeptide-transferase
MANEIFLNLLKVFVLGFFSALLSLFLVPLYLRIALRFDLTDKPKLNKGETPITAELSQEKIGTPTMAGVIIWLPVLILAFLFLWLKIFFPGSFGFLNFIDRRETYLPLAGLFLGGLFGLIDDLLRHFNLIGLKRRDNLLIYLTIGCLFAWWFITKLNFNFIDLVDQRFYIGSFFFLLYFLFVFLATVLSADITDGVDGLFGGLSFLIIFILTIFAFINGDYYLASFGGSLLGSLLVYLWFNFHPAKFFDGNTGSFSVGIAIVLMAFFTQSTLLLPLLAIVFVIEALSVILQLFSKKIFKKKIFLAAPIHYHFRYLGLPEAGITFRFWVINFFGCLIAIFIYLFLKLT